LGRRLRVGAGPELAGARCGYSDAAFDSRLHAAVSPPRSTVLSTALPIARPFPATEQLRASNKEKLQDAHAKYDKEVYDLRDKLNYWPPGTSRKAKPAAAAAAAAESEL
jgi:hypothetical protein